MNSENKVADYRLKVWILVHIFDVHRSFHDFEKWLHSVNCTWHHVQYCRITVICYFQIILQMQLWIMSYNHYSLTGSKVSVDKEWTCWGLSVASRLSDYTAALVYTWSLQLLSSNISRFSMSTHQTSPSKKPQFKKTKSQNFKC